MKRQIVIALAIVSIMLLVGTTYLFVATTPATALVGPLRPGIGVGVAPGVGTVGSGVGVRPGIGAGAPGAGLRIGIG
jgi:hypothetical protein